MVSAEVRVKGLGGAAVTDPEKLIEGLD